METVAIQNLLKRLLKIKSVINGHANIEIINMAKQINLLKSKGEFKKLMAEIFNKENSYKPDPSIWTGIIEIEDFNTNFPNQKRIDNQIAGIKESNQRKEREKYKHMTLEELKEMKIISNTNGRPLPSLTNEKWQKEFNIRKLFITPYSKNIKKLKGNGFLKYSRQDEETQGTYYSLTNWQEYCRFINDVLKNIRSGQIDYCYYIYQIEELLKFHFDNLKTKYCDGYWEVWID